MAAILTIGLNPLKEISTVSYICGNCQKHCSPDDKECKYCGAELTDRYIVLSNDVLVEIHRMNTKFRELSEEW